MNQDVHDLPAGERASVILKGDNKVSSIARWGKIFCIASPLLIAVSTITLQKSSLAAVINTLPFWINTLLFLIAFLFFHQLDKSNKILAHERIDQQKRNQAEINRMTTFISHLQEGNFSENYQFENKILTDLLASLKAKLSHQKEEDEKVKWTSEGTAKFAEILRGSGTLVSLSDAFIKSAIKYVGLNQGSVFICEKDERNETILALKACYAYERKKYLTKTIRAGEGLVGECFLERETIILKKIPDNYIKITSGLGEAVPGFVAIIPIKANEVIEGILEVAGFKELQSYQIKFLEKICEAFASVMRSIKSNEETKSLLEATKQQTQQLQLKEEQIRQNMEEMIATQEQLTRQLEENKLVRERVERRERIMALTTILSETDPFGTITFVNDKFCEISKYRQDELIGKPQNIVRHPDMPKELFALFWKTIKRGEVFNGIVKNRAKDGSAYWVDATIVPVKDDHGHIVKYTGARYHIKDEELAIKLYNKQAIQHHWPTLNFENEIQLPIHERMPLTISK